LGEGKVGVQAIWFAAGEIAGLSTAAAEGICARAGVGADARSQILRRMKGMQWMKGMEWLLRR
jgi:F0F1-type ATP synthase membrane subunit c/vacuolar-type H+-ATPase subunit K